MTAVAERTSVFAARRQRNCPGMMSQVAPQGGHPGAASGRGIERFVLTRNARFIAIFEGRKVLQVIFADTMHDRQHLESFFIEVATQNVTKLANRG